MQILIIDDHPLVRDALKDVLEELSEGAVVLEASTAREGLEQAASLHALDIILLDLTLPDRSGFEILAELRARWPSVSVVILSAHESRPQISKALEIGAVGFIPKSSSRQVMMNALQLIISGGVYVPPQILRTSPAEGKEGRQAENRAELLPRLTPRQQEILWLIMEGKSNKAICRTLDIAEPTVKNHVTAILRALNARNRTEAVVIANRSMRTSNSD